MATKDSAEKAEYAAEKDEPAKDEKPAAKAKKAKPAKDKKPAKAGIHIEDIRSGILNALGEEQFEPKDIPVEDLGDGIVKAFGLDKLDFVADMASDAAAKVQDYAGRLKDLALKKYG